MNSEQIREEYLKIIKKEFPSVILNPSTIKNGNIRFSPYVPNKKRNKRWMMIDANPEYVHIAMDHSKGDISNDDVKDLGLKIGKNGKNSAIEVGGNVEISIFTEDPYDFMNEKFIKFLHKHYNSYLKLVGLS